jgi:hypothetical protein
VAVPSPSAISRFLETISADPFGEPPPISEYVSPSVEAKRPSTGWMT